MFTNVLYPDSVQWTPPHPHMVLSDRDIAGSCVFVCAMLVGLLQINYADFVVEKVVKT